MSERHRVLTVYRTGHLPWRAISFLVTIFNAILIIQYFPSEWKHPLVISILKPGKDPPLPSSYRPMSLLDTIGKLFEKILLTIILKEVSEHGLCLGSDPNTALRYNSPASLKE